MKLHFCTGEMRDDVHLVCGCEQTLHIDTLRTIIYRLVRPRRRQGPENNNRTISLNKQNNNSAHTAHSFYFILL